MGTSEVRPRAFQGRIANEGVGTVSGTDKAKNKIEDLGGKAKETLGRATGDRTTENEGRGDQSKASLKDAGEKVKDAFKK